MTAVTDGSSASKLHTFFRRYAYDELPAVLPDLLESDSSTVLERRREENFGWTEKKRHQEQPKVKRRATLRVTDLNLWVHSCAVVIGALASDRLFILSAVWV